MPGGSYLTARVIHAMLMAMVLVIIAALFGALAYGADLPTGGDLVRTVAVVLIGGASFAALALALTAAIPNADAAPAIVNATILPLLFISGVFVPLGANTPQWIITLGDVFPVKHFVDAFLGAFYGPPNFPFAWSDIAIVADGVVAVAALPMSSTGSANAASTIPPRRANERSMWVFLLERGQMSWCARCFGAERTKAPWTRRGDVVDGR